MYEQKKKEVEKGTTLLVARCKHETLEEGCIARRLVWYSPYMEPQFVRCSSTENVSGVIDALLRITTKVTEYYAGDVLFTIQNLQAAIKRGQPFAALLLFRESGVSEKPVGFQPDTGTPFAVLPERTEVDAIQAWLLACAPGDTEQECFTLLRRVHVMNREEGFQA